MAGRPIYYVTDPATGKSTIVPRGDEPYQAATPQEAAQLAIVGAKPGEWIPTTKEEEIEIREQIRRASVREETTATRPEEEKPPVTPPPPEDKLTYEKFIGEEARKYGFATPLDMMMAKTVGAAYYYPKYLLKKSFVKYRGEVEKIAEKAPPGIFRGAIRGGLGVLPYAAYPPLMLISPETEEAVQAIIERPKETIKEIGAYAAQAPGEFAGEIVGALVVSGVTTFGKAKIKKLIKAKAKRVTDVKTVSVAGEVYPETTMTTPHGDVKVTFSKAGNIKHFKILSGSEVTIRDWFGLGKKRIYYPKTVGKVAVTNIDDVYYSQGRFITGLNRNQILSKIKAMAKVNEKISKAIGVGKTWAGKPIDKLSKKELLSFLRNKKILIQRKKLTKGGFVYGEIGYQPSPEELAAQGYTLPKDIKMQLAEARIKELKKYPKLKFKRMYPERAITFVKTLPPKEEVVGWEVFKPRPIPKVKPRVAPPIPIAPELQKMQVELAKRVAIAEIKPTKIVPLVPPTVFRPPKVVPKVKLVPIIKPMLAPPIEKVKPAVIIKPTVAMKTRIKAMLKPIEAVKIGVKEIAKVKLEPALIPIVAPPIPIIKPIEKIRPIVAPPIITPPKPPIYPTRKIPPRFRFPKIKPIYPKPRKIPKGRAIGYGYTPSIYAREVGIWATPKMEKLLFKPPKRIYEPFVVRPMIRRKKKKVKKVKRKKLGFLGF